MPHHKAQSRTPGRRKASAQTAAPRQHPNRIFELTQERHWTYAEVAERVRSRAREKKLKNFLKTHEVTIGKLASGLRTLTLDWMNMLGEVYSVPATDLIAQPLNGDMIRIKVTFYFQGGIWLKNHQWPATDCKEIMIPQDIALAGVELYAGELKGPASDARFPEKTVIICSRIMAKPDEIAINRRYHVRATRPDGTTEETIRCLTQDRDGRYWLKPESNHPAHQTWMPLEGADGIKVEIIGRVRGVYIRED
jgi:hypothetical protein